MCRYCPTHLRLSESLPRVTNTGRIEHTRKPLVTLAFVCGMERIHSVSTQDIFKKETNFHNCTATIGDSRGAQLCTQIRDAPRARALTAESCTTCRSHQDLSEFPNIPCSPQAKIFPESFPFLTPLFDLLSCKTESSKSKPKSWL